MRVHTRALVTAVAALAVLATAAPAASAKNKGGGNTSSATAVAKVPVAIPPSTAARHSLVLIPLTIGKKAKNKLVASANSVSITYSMTGAPGPGVGPWPDGSLWETDMWLAAPNGREVNLDPPGWNDRLATAVGPVTETADSPFGMCDVDSNGPAGSASFCDPTEQQDPEGILVPPSYAGTLGNSELAMFRGVRAKGTWLLKVRDYDTLKGSTITGATLKVPLTSAPSNK